PPDRPSVKALDEVQARIEILGSLYVAVEHPEPEKRKSAVAFIEDALGDIEGELIGTVESNPLPTASYLWDNRFLFVSLEDLEKALARLPEYIEERRKKANPLLLDFEDEPEPEDSEEKDRLERMRERLDRAEYRYESAKAGYVSEDGAFQVVVVRTAFESSKTSKGRKLVRAVRAAVAKAEKKFPKARFGITGDVITTMQEQESIIRGMATAAGITVLLVLISLVLYFRALRAVWWILAGLLVGSVVTFGAAELIIGHLNIASAFLAAIVVGNGINPNIILIARYREERSDAVSNEDALARAIAGAFRGTVAASLTAGVAYASLIATEFRGFRDFGIIGSLGMALCWVAAFTVVPAVILRFGGKSSGSWADGESWGVALSKLLPEKRYSAVLAIGAVLSVLSIGQTYRFVVGDPLEEDWRKLRSSSSDLQETRYWNERMKAELVNAPNKYLAGRFLIATESAEDASAIRGALKPYATGDSDARLLAYMRGFDD
ncbi:MAG: MMPL family transporter, partial [Myxococcota bacterium]